MVSRALAVCPRNSSKESPQIVAVPLIGTPCFCISFRFFLSASFLLSFSSCLDPFLNILTSFLPDSQNVQVCSQQASHGGPQGCDGENPHPILSTRVTDERFFCLPYVLQESSVQGRFVQQKRNLAIHEYLSARLLKSVSAKPLEENGS